MTGAELAAIRKAAGLSQAALGQRVGIGRHAVSYWENKPQVVRHAWAVERMAPVLDLPDIPSINRARRGWADRLTREMQAASIAACLARTVAQQALEREQASQRRVRCGAKTRKGTPCRARSEPGKARCKFHGGMSTGARTPEGKARIAEAQRRRWARWRKEREADSRAVGGESARRDEG